MIMKHSLENQIALDTTCFDARCIGVFQNCGGEWYCWKQLRLLDSSVQPGSVLATPGLYLADSVLRAISQLIGRMPEWAAASMC